MFIVRLAAWIIVLRFIGETWPSILGVAFFAFHQVATTLGIIGSWIGLCLLIMAGLLVLGVLGQLFVNLTNTTLASVKARISRRP